MPIAKRDADTFVALHTFVVETLDIPSNKVFLFSEEELKFCRLRPYVRVHCDPIDIGDADFAKINAACKAHGYKFAASTIHPLDAHARERTRRKERSKNRIEEKEEEPYDEGVLIFK